MKIKWILMALLLLAGLDLSAQDEGIQQQFEQELKEKNEKVVTITCPFVQTRKVFVLDNEVKKPGTFYFQQPNDMLLSFDDGDYIKITKEWFEMKTAGHISQTKVSSNPMLRRLGAILSACVVGNFDEMVKGFAMDFERSEQEWVVTLKPKRGRAVSKINRIVIHFDNRDMSLNKLKMEEKSGDYTEYAFSQKQFNVEVDSQLFHISR